MQRITYTPKDFAWTKWTAADIKRLVPQIIATKKVRYATIKKIHSKERTFENIVYAIEASSNGINDIGGKIHLLHNASPDKAVREAAKRASEAIEKKMIALERDPKIWQALKDYERGAWKNERKHLDEPSKKLFHDMFLEYRRMGFDLSPQKQKRLRALEQELTKVSSAFHNNINRHHDFILVSEDEAVGLPLHYKQGLKRDKKGNYIVTLAYPDYHPFIKYSENEAKRKEISEKFLQCGGKKNLLVLKKMLALRAEHAKILGYKNHADYRTETRMAKTGSNAFTFATDLIKKVENNCKKDVADLRDLKREMTRNKKAQLFFYDISYYGHELQKRRFHLSSEEIQEYFPLPRVLSGTFQIYSKLFGVTFQKLSGYPLWHPEAKLYEVRDKSGTILSYFALDLHPREDKYGHAAVFGTIDGRTTSFRGGPYVAPLSVMLANFTRPRDKQPSLLSHGEVETFFHEFGHVMHRSPTKARYGSQSGTNTARDFVEAPSQMLEHWVWNEKSLAFLSAHQKTGKPLPKVLLKKLLASKHHLLRYSATRQLILALFDLTLHSTNKALGANTIYRSLVKKYTGIDIPAHTYFPARFGHLDGYDAGYYGYMWSNVYAADMFTRFEREGILNTKTGVDYRKWILEKGGSYEEINLVSGFLGRRPSNKAFLKEIGAV